MVQRCTDVNDKHYADYGGRGIKVDERWLDVRNFYVDMGERREGFSIERMDVDGDYAPDNCFWMPMKFQASNRRKWRHSAEGKRRIGDAQRARRKATE